MDNYKKIIITQNNWFVETDSFCEIIDPTNLTITVSDKQIQISQFTYSVQKALSILKMNNLTSVYIEFNSTTNGLCFAEINELTKQPSFISIDTSALLDLNDFKFTLGHEIGHFINPYKKILFNLNNKEWFSNILIICLFIIAILFLVLDYSIILLIMKITENGSATRIISIIISFCLFIIYSPINILEIFVMMRNHWEEYWCDSLSMKLFPDVNVKSTFLGKYNESDDNFYAYEMSHPTYCDRINNILKNKRVYQTKTQTIANIYDKLNYKKMFNIMFKRSF